MSSFDWDVFLVRTYLPARDDGDDGDDGDDSDDSDDGDDGVDGDDSDAFRISK